MLPVEKPSNYRYLWFSNIVAHLLYADRSYLHYKLCLI